MKAGAKPDTQRLDDTENIQSPLVAILKVIVLTQDRQDSHENFLSNLPLNPLTTCIVWLRG